MPVRIDGHQHFWSLHRDDYGWLTPELQVLYRDFAPADLSPLLDQAGIDQTILVQAAASVDETGYLLDIAEQHHFVAGVVGWVDMDSTPQAIKDLHRLAQHPKFVGIRPMIQEIDNPAWIDRPELGIVFDTLVENKLCFDALVRPIHLPYLLNCLTRHPELAVVIDHGAKPDIAAGEWQPWADSISTIANQSSTYCKISGLITEAGDSQTYDDVMPYLDHLISAFGPERLIWGSDWPVINLAGDYNSWHNATAAGIKALSEQDRDKIMGHNAIDFYNLKH